MLNSVEESVTIAKDLTLNLNENTITGQVKITKGTVTVENGTITRNATGNSAEECTTLFVRGGSVTVDGLTVEAQASSAMAIAVADAKLTVETVTITGNGTGIGIYNGADVLINDADIQVNSNAISSNSGVTTAAVTIKGGTYKCLLNIGDYRDSAIYWANHGTLTIEGGEFTSADITGAALYVKNGTVNVKGGTFYGTKDGIKIDTTASDTTTIEVNISGGDFSGSRSGMYISTAHADKTKDAPEAAVNVTGGTFALTEGTTEAKGAFYTQIKDNITPEVTFTNGEGTTPAFNGELNTDLEGFIAGLSLIHI